MEKDDVKLTPLALRRKGEGMRSENGKIAVPHAADASRDEAQTDLGF